MRIVFVGSVDFSRHCLEEVFRQKGQVLAVLNPECQYAMLNSDYVDLKSLATEHHVLLHRVRKINDAETVEFVRSLQPDVIFVFGFSQLISKEILNIPPLGCIGTHPALLPRNRGRHPLIWTLVEGLSESGLTFFFMDEGADSGDILWQKAFPVTLEDDAGTLYAKVKRLATEAIQEFIPQLESGAAPRRPQDHSASTYWRKRGEVDGEIHWPGPTLTAYNVIRALARPYVGAHTYSGNHRVVIWKSRLCPSVGGDAIGSPGEICRETAGGLRVQCGDGLLELIEWDALGIHLKPGDILGSLKR